MMSWIDMHCHLDKLEEGVEEALARAEKAGVHHLVTIGTEPADHPVVLDLARKYHPRVHCTLGVHPHEGSLFTESIGQWIETHAVDPTVIAIGEIGLDYYYNHSAKSEQIHSFRQQLAIAEKLKMPVEIHTRDAEYDTISVLKEFNGRVKGLIHCFTGTEKLAEESLALGFNISISGVVTFKNADSLRSTVQKIPLDRLHVETDAPFLAPVPQRGQQNTPAYVVHTAEAVADLKDVSLAELARQTRKNAETLFPKFSWRQDIPSN